jgi:hypothetical protein
MSPGVDSIRISALPRRGMRDQADEAPDPERH